MGLFRKRSFRKNKAMKKENENLTTSKFNSPPKMSLTNTLSSSFSTEYQDSNKVQKHLDENIDRNASSIEKDNNDDDDQSSIVPTSIDQLPHLITTLKTCRHTYSKESAQALQTLFAISEHTTLHEINCIRMIREADSQLVPTLLDFLHRCEPSSSEQYMALLVLNNVSVPKENKKLVGLDHDGLFVLTRLLCRYPDIPFISIILVNLSFCDGALMKEIVDDKNNEIQFFEALTYALKVSIRSKQDDESSQIPVVEGDETPKQLIQGLILDESLSVSNHYNGECFDIHNMALPETAKWALCGIKNLTRPLTKDSQVAKLLLEYDILPILLHILKVNTIDDGQWNENNIEIIRNDPYTWDANSIQDTALYILLNLSVCNSSRQLLKNQNIGHVVSLIGQYSSSPSSSSSSDYSSDQEKQKDLQCLKARMILAYLYGSEDHFGPARLSDDDYQKDYFSDLLIKGSEALLLVELLANTLQCRAKSGAGGYNATTFNPKKVLFAIRCLLTNKYNIKTLFVTCGVKLNALLFKAIAIHTIQDSSMIDSGAAEDACFSLYLLSSHGFMSPFLPPEGYGFPFYKIISQYFHNKSCTKVSRYASKQLMLRSSYLNFDGNLMDDDEPQSIDSSDMELEDVVLYAAGDIEVGANIQGAKPLDDIFGRPVTRKKQQVLSDDSSDYHDTITFHCALDAVQDFSRNNKDDENILDIDEVELANNIAKCANDVQAESYGFKWTWQDGEIQEQELRSKLNNFRKRKVESFRGLLENVKIESKNLVKPFEPISIFKCGDFRSVVD